MSCEEVERAQHQVLLSVTSTVIQVNPQRLGSTREPMDKKVQVSSHGRLESSGLVDKHTTALYALLSIRLDRDV